MKAMMFALLWLSAALAQTAPSPASQLGGSVSGVITDALTKVPVADARVLVARVYGPLMSSVVGSTDGRGSFAIRNIPPGDYRVFAEHDDYLRKEFTAPITVTAGRDVSNVTIALTATGVLYGRVLTETGDPAPKVYVRALTSNVVAETRTNDLGEYRLFGLAPGSYVVSAERYLAPRLDGTQYLVPTPPCPDCRGEGQFMMGVPNLLKTGGFIDPRALAGQSSQPVFHPGTPDRAAAQPIDVGPGARVAVPDLRIR